MYIVKEYENGICVLEKTFEVHQEALVFAFAKLWELKDVEIVEE